MQPGQRYAIATCVVLTGTLLYTVPATAAAPAHIHHARPTLLALMSSRMLQLLNQDRAGERVGPLVLDTLLTRVATAHSRDMAQNHYFAHDAPNGMDPFTRLSRMGVRFTAAGENIGQAFRMNPLLALVTLNAQMMAEPLVEGTHHFIIMNRLFHRVGIGIYLDTRRDVYLTEDFTN